MKIANGIEMLSLSYQVGSHTMVIHPVVIYDDAQMVLIDTGIPGSRELILKQFNEADLSPEKLNTIILTHQDIDHIGSLPEFLGKSSNRPKVYAHKGDQPYIEGELPLIKMSPERREVLLGSLSEQDRAQFERVFSPDSEANIDVLVQEGQTLSFGGGLTVIETPGHTPGHFSLYHRPSQTLIAGDAMTISEDKLNGPNPKNTPDMDTAMKSISKFLEFPIQNVICSMAAF
ncbi:MBL fold metallo-hydrolase [Paenibacillus sp. SN-8-1]|uniref:MBL fold metallo-hydrolase n=1 Tax=Paenibacillus sp. SN-8-1 TaxID=3435409 RepID=UPI003D9A97E1